VSITSKNNNKRPNSDNEPNSILDSLDNRKKLQIEELNLFILDKESNTEELYLFI
jgi:hypothetical protein